MPVVVHVKECKDLHHDSNYATDSDISGVQLGPYYRAWPYIDSSITFDLS